MSRQRIVSSPVPEIKTIMHFANTGTELLHGARAPTANPKAAHDMTVRRRSGSRSQNQNVPASGPHEAW